MSKEKPKCPNCGSEDVSVRTLPLSDEEELIYCNNCKQINIITKVEISEED